MVFQGEIVGIVCVDSDRPRTFNDSHIALVQAFADQAATGLANARLYAAAQHRAEEIERVKNFNGDLLNSIEAGILLETDDDRIERLVEGRSRLRLYDAKGGSILLCEDEWALRHAMEAAPELEFLEAAP